MYKRMLMLREEHKLSQQKIGEIIGCSQRAYCHYEKGQRGIPIPIIIRLADYYNVSVDYIIGRTDNPEFTE